MRKTIIKCDCCGSDIPSASEIVRLDLFINARLETRNEVETRVSYGGGTNEPQLVHEGNLASLAVPKDQEKDYCVGCQKKLISALIETFDRTADACRAAENARQARGVL